MSNRANVTLLIEAAVELVTRKQAGGDCTEDESAWIKRFFDLYGPEAIVSGYLAEAYPLQIAEWWDDTEHDLRPESLTEAELVALVLPAPVPRAPLTRTVLAAKRAAYGDSDRLELALLREALRLALLAAGIEEPELSDDEIERLST